MEAVRVLATDATKYSSAELGDIAYEFGDNHPIQCTIPVGVLVRACRENRNLKSSQDIASSCARVVALAEKLVDYKGYQESSYFQGIILALHREIDSLRAIRE